MGTTLGDKIHALRIEKGLTLEDLADKTDSSKGYIWELENRETRNPSAEKLAKIAEVLSVTIDYLLDEKKSQPDDEILKQAYFRGFEKLSPPDKEKIMQMIDAWGTKK
ncbi:MAG: helix-turn-helix domain-containing protein [Dongiaceae bacterium]